MRGQIRGFENLNVDWRTGGVEYQRWITELSSPTLVDQLAAGDAVEPPARDVCELVVVGTAGRQRAVGD